MNTIEGMKVIRAVTLKFEDLIIVGTEKQIVLHMIHTSYQYFESCKWFNPYPDVQSKVLIAIDDADSTKTLVHNVRDNFKNSLKQLEMLNELFDGCAIIRLVDVLYLPSLEVTDEWWSVKDWSELLELATDSQPEPTQGDQIKLFRKKHKISQTKFAEMVRDEIPSIKIHQTNVSEIERNIQQFNEYDWQIVKSLIVLYIPE